MRKIFEKTLEKILLASYNNVSDCSGQQPQTSPRKGDRDMNADRTNMMPTTEPANGTAAFCPERPEAVDTT